MKTPHLKPWIEAVRLRTLPVSLAGVTAATALALRFDTFKPVPVTICFIFATLAQIASNFANEYFDFCDGLDRKGRSGPRRGVTEGDISPKAMRNAALGTLALAALVGCTLIHWGGWWLVAAGIAIILGALAYSAGPYPLSRHGLGEIAVIFFFGIAPVTLTFYLQAGSCPPAIVWATSLAIGLLGANVLIVNNYRDRNDDKTVGKVTLAVRFGNKAMACLYLANALIAIALTSSLWSSRTTGIVCATLFLAAYIATWNRMRHSSGAKLNPLLGITAILLFAFSLIIF